MSESAFSEVGPVSEGELRRTELGVDVWVLNGRLIGNKGISKLINSFQIRPVSPEDRVLYIVSDGDGAEIEMTGGGWIDARELASKVGPTLEPYRAIVVASCYGGTKFCAELAQVFSQTIVVGVEHGMYDNYADNPRLTFTGTRPQDHGPPVANSLRFVAFNGTEGEEYRYDFLPHNDATLVPDWLKQLFAPSGDFSYLVRPVAGEHTVQQPLVRSI